MWNSNYSNLLWISCLLTLGKLGHAQQILDVNADLPDSTLDFIANDESVIILEPKDAQRYSNFQYEVPDDRRDARNYGDNGVRLMEDSNSSQSRINLGFLFGSRSPFSSPGRPTRRIPTVDSMSNRRNGLSPEYEGNPFLSTANNNNFNNIDRTTRRTTSKRPNNKQPQWQGSNRQESNEFQNPGQQQNWQQPSAPSWEQSSSSFNGFPGGQFQNNQQSFAQNQPWGSSFGNSNWERPSPNPISSNWQSSNSWQTPSTTSNNNNWQQSSNNWQQPSNNWQQPSSSSVGNEQANNGWSNEDKPTWGSQPQSWTTKRPTNSGSNKQKTTTKKPNNGWDNSGGDQQPVWTEKTTTSGRYRPSPTKKPQRKTISELKCEEYSKPYTQTINALPLSLDPDVLTINVGKCDRNAQALIVGGQKSELGEFPHMAAVGFRTGRGGISWNCGGSLVSEKFVLTAAHCTDSSLGKPVSVRLGELNLVRNDDGASPENFKVVQVYPHPDYRSNVKYNDIALLRLDRTVEFSNSIRPACLYTSETTSMPRAIATGWGTVGFGDRSSDVLLKVGLNFIDSQKCASLYRSEQSSSLHKGIVDSQLCAGELQGGYDTCLGDSGGPLQVTSDTNQCIYKIVGVTSFGKFCGEKNSPGVYTRVSSFIPWIESIVWP
ncbi:hypothetical protein M8J77_010447 [Diaphorina citri]|nr:hypothetical protein M8J77_010447 [Diaphorina citri]